MININNLEHLHSLIEECYIHQEKVKIGTYKYKDVYITISDLKK